MIRLIAYLAAVLVFAAGLSWLADNPGTVSIAWPALNLKADPSVFQVVVTLLVLLTVFWIGMTLFRHVWNSPRQVGQFITRRKQQRGIEALSHGMIAIGSGDPAGARKAAALARSALPNEPLTHLLRAQAAQISGDSATARRIFEAMLASPDTEQLGLRGLFTEAEREKEPEAQRQFAERALMLNPKLAWASTALFDMQCKAGDFEGALETLAGARKNELVDRAAADRRRAVLLTGLALKCEESDPNKALALATEAHGLAPDLVPAAALAGRMLAARGNTAKAAKVLQRTWTQSPHPDLATAYAFARIGDSPRDRLERVRQLAGVNPHEVEGAIAVANAAIDAKQFDEARDALKPHLEGNLTQRLATLMARIESEQFADKGRVREWLARAVNAPRDPAWTADGIVSEEWAPVSPVSGQLDAFQWKVAVETHGARDTDLVTRKIEELVALGAPRTIEADDSAERQAPAVKAEPKVSAPEPAAVAKADTGAVAAVTDVPATAPVRSGPPTTSKPVEAAKPVIAVADAAPADTAPKTKADAADKPKAAAPVEIKPVSKTAQPDAARQPKPEAKTAPAPVTSIAAKDTKDSKDSKDTRVFVTPHAPDDPGPDAGEAEAPAKGTRPNYRAMT